MKRSGRARGVVAVRSATRAVVSAVCLLPRVSATLPFGCSGECRAPPRWPGHPSRVPSIRHWAWAMRIVSVILHTVQKGELHTLRQ